MSYDVTSAEYLGEYKIRVSFENGKTGVVDFLPYVKRGGVFAKLEDPGFFKRFEINSDLGVLTWGKEVDIAPETLYSEATGEPLPQWILQEYDLKETA